MTIEIRRLLPNALNFIGGGVLLHAAFWIALIGFYPWSKPIQALFFWNPRARKFIGLWYVDVLIVLIPALRRILLIPFRQSLNAEAQLNLLEAYYEASQVRVPDSALPNTDLVKAIPDLRGQILLLGKSGTGKTHFVRHLIRRSRRPTVFVPANRCGMGVIEAIANILPPHVNDENLIEKLIFSGALDIYIDGLNEVNADIRAQIYSFLRVYSRGNVLVTSQPIAWTPPGFMKCYELQPLARHQILNYLKLKGGEGREFLSKCEKFISGHIEDPKLSGDARERDLEVLSIPFDLDLVVQLLAGDHLPSLFNLQEQHLELIRKGYKDKTFKDLPVEQIAESAYTARVGNSRQFDASEVDPTAVRLLVEEKILLVRHTDKVEYFFRHDKSQDFFILLHVLKSPHLQTKHLEDVRFLGVYLLLADKLESSRASQLKSLLALRAAKTQEHAISDAFILKLEKLGKLQEPKAS